MGSQGEGLLVMQSQQGEVTIEKVFPGSIHHIPGFTAHRLVNTGEKKLSAIAIWPSVAGHNYDFLEEVGFRVRVVQDDTGYKIIRA
ncbi:glucose-6-phosphate isomerase archaeal [Vibrio maritimus]|uniref:glucose-6-phosphate isomerase n=1 Tax=Vibrio maritimus TaxID=990268 RepID=A0A090SB89_9VIBR|nr:glucose-6-phosphate isomerase archaeal [Vibrio maritimus]